MRERLSTPRFRRAASPSSGCTPSAPGRPGPATRKSFCACRFRTTRSSTGAASSSIRVRHGQVAGIKALLARYHQARAAITEAVGAAPSRALRLVAIRRRARPISSMMRRDVLHPPCSRRLRVAGRAAAAGLHDPPGGVSSGRCRTTRRLSISLRRPGGWTGRATALCRAAARRWTVAKTTELGRPPGETDDRPLAAHAAPGSRCRIPPWVCA